MKDGKHQKLRVLFVDQWQPPQHLYCESVVDVVPRNHPAVLGVYVKSLGDRKSFQYTRIVRWARYVCEWNNSMPPVRGSALMTFLICGRKVVRMVWRKTRNVRVVACSGSRGRWGRWLGRNLWQEAGPRMYTTWVDGAIGVWVDTTGGSPTVSRPCRDPKVRAACTIMGTC